LHTQTSILSLKRLILDDRFVNLKTQVNREINLMSILGIAHRELQHSNFLAWLFTPNETHNKADYFIKEFIKLYFVENEYEDLGGMQGLSVFDFVKLDLSDIQIHREYKNIDLLMISPTNKLVIVIENKIFSKELKGQLSKYHKYVEENYGDYDFRIYIYLSLFEQEISEEGQQNYIQLTYEHIAKLLGNALESDLSESVRFIISQYIQTLKVIMNENEEIEKLAKELYEEYKSSFDLVYKYIRPSSVSGGATLVPNQIQKYIAEDKRILPSKTTKTYKRFVPKSLVELQPQLIKAGIIDANYKMDVDSLFWFEFVLKQDQIFFKFLIGAYHNQNSRRRLFEHFLKFKEVFPNNKEPLANSWNVCTRCAIVSKKEYLRFEEEEDFGLDALIKKRYEKVVSEVIPSIVKRIEKIC